MKRILKIIGYILLCIMLAVGMWKFPFFAIIIVIVIIANMKPYEDNTLKSSDIEEYEILED